MCTNTPGLDGQFIEMLPGDNPHEHLYVVIDKKTGEEIGPQHFDFINCMNKQYHINQKDSSRIKGYYRGYDKESENWINFDKNGDTILLGNIISERPGLETTCSICGASVDCNESEEIPHHPKQATFNF